MDERMPMASDKAPHDHTTDAIIAGAFLSGSTPNANWQSEQERLAGRVNGVLGTVDDALGGVVVWWVGVLLFALTFGGGGWLVAKLTGSEHAGDMAAGVLFCAFAVVVVSVLLWSLYTDGEDED